jgi:hypothetical protein
MDEAAVTQEAIRGELSSLGAIVGEIGPNDDGGLTILDGATFS